MVLIMEEKRPDYQRVTEKRVIPIFLKAQGDLRIGLFKLEHNNI